MSYDSEPSADRHPLVRFGMDALCQETIDRYRNAFKVSTPKSPWIGDSQNDFLLHVGAAARDSKGDLHPTQAGLLAFGQEYEITNYLPRYLLDYREETSGERRWDDRVVSESGDWSGNVMDFYFLVTTRLQRHFPKPFNTDAHGTRHGSHNPVTESLNEAVTNALAHAYYGASTTVRVILKADQLEVTNPGALLIDRDVAIAGGYSEPRNPTLLRLFAFIGASDRAGSGLQEMWTTWKNTFDVVPTLEELHSPAVIRLTLPLNGVAEKSNQLSLLRGDERENALIALLSSSEKGFTVHEVAAATGLSERGVQKTLKRLYDVGRISRKRDGRTLTYVVRDNL